MCPAEWPDGLLLFHLFLPALPEKMAGEWLPRPAAYRPAGTQKNFLKKIGKSVTLFKLFSILYKNKKIGKGTLSLRNQTWFGGAKIGVYTLS